MQGSRGNPNIVIATSRRKLGPWLFVLLLIGCAQPPPDPFADISPAMRSWTDAQGIAGFDKLRWGMTETEIRRLYPGFVEAYDARLNNPKGYRHLQMRSYALAGCAFAVNLAFFNGMADELADIQLSYSGDKAETCAVQIKSAIERAFGPGKIDRVSGFQSAPGGGSITFPILYTIWDGPQLTVMVDETTNPKGPRTLTLDYIHTGAPGTFVTSVASE
jgi:hypothetical protein